MDRSARRQLTPVPFTAVTLTDSFWAPRQEINRRVTLPHIYEKLVESGRLQAFSLDIEREVPSPIVQIFGDSDLAKWLEAACYALCTQPDPDLARLVGAVSEQVASAQQEDGYLNTHFIAVQPEMRWSNLRDWHEMYCAGHLIEAAIAHHQATGEQSLLDALCRYADHIDRHFGPHPHQKAGYGGHPEIELALVRLYHATEEPRYLALAKYLLEERGRSDPHYFDVEAIARGEDPAEFWAKTYEYCQAHVPIREQDQVVGHAVRAMYLLAAAADLAHEYDDPSLLAVCETQWGNLVQRRMYLTGGIGPSHDNEGFTSDYDLPDESAYAETCAAIALVLWNHRLLQVEGDGKYADIIEQTLYNGFISGVSLDGADFFYVNPLASAGDHHRQPWFDCPCCPPNVGRMVASLGTYLYSTDDEGIWLHLYAQNRASLAVDGRRVDVAVASGYPWEGEIDITLDPEQAQRFALRLRIPGWCESWRLAVNGSPLADVEPQRGYVTLRRRWQPGDRVSLTLEMPIQAVYAHPRARQLQGRLALQRGPIVYCVEEVDNPLGNLDCIEVDPAQIPHFGVAFEPDLLGGVTVLSGPGVAIDDAGWDAALYRRSRPPKTRPVVVTAVPYALWDNRAPGSMRVWLRSG